jgi:hypothetical protein
LSPSLPATPIGDWPRLAIQDLARDNFVTNWLCLCYNFAAILAAGRYSDDAAMTKTKASSALRGRRVKFTPQALDEVKKFLAEGISRDEIANLLGVTVGSLQVTCSRLGISLRRRSGSWRSMADVKRGTTLDVNGVPGVSHATPFAKFAIVMRRNGEEQTNDIPLPLAAIGVLALEAMSRDLEIPDLLAQIMVSAINKDLIHKVLR